MDKTIIRVFPRLTNMTPLDPLSYYVDKKNHEGLPDIFTAPAQDVDEVHISVAFTWDKPQAEFLADQWHAHGYNVKIGGAAYDDVGGEFVPGRYLKQGVTITSRGCVKKCWFCTAWRREGNLRELEIKDGYIIQDNNLLACSDQHIKDVFAMLSRQKERACFTGGLESEFLKEWHVQELIKLNPESMFFAYDTPDDLEHLYAAGRMFENAGLTVLKRKLYAYVLIGFPKDTFEQAEHRMEQVMLAGFIPFSMLYMDIEGKVNENWKQFHRLWANRFVVMSRNKEFLASVDEHQKFYIMERNQENESKTN